MVPTPPPPSPPALPSQYFTTFTSGAGCEANGAGSIRTLADCSAAAVALGFSDTAAEDDGHDGQEEQAFSLAPNDCYFHYGVLKFNSAGTNTRVARLRRPIWGSPGGQGGLTRCVGAVAN